MIKGQGLAGDAYRIAGLGPARARRPPIALDNAPPSARTRSSAAIAAVAGQPKPTPSRAAINQNQAGRALTTKRGELPPH